MLKNFPKNKKIFIFFFLITILSFFVPYFLLAQERPLEIDYPEIGGIDPETVAIGLPEYVRYIFNFSIIIIGLVLFGILIWSGFLYLTSTGNPSKLKEAKERITSSFLGAILLLSGYIILTTIDPDLKIVRLPLLERPEICRQDNDCPRGHFCNAEKKCEMVTSCNINEDCPYTYECLEGKCEKAIQLASQIFWEIPLGRMAEGLWERERTQNFNNLLINFENFLQKETRIDNLTFNRVSNLNKYLETLTNSCLCEELEGICQRARNFSFPVGCAGDPCKEVRNQINDVLKINREKSIELTNYKENLVNFKNAYEEEGRKFRKLLEEILQDCQGGTLLTRAEYYENLAFFEEQGGTTKLQRLYYPAGDDPLVFYCQVGGTLFDYPYTPEGITFEKLEIATGETPFDFKPILEEPLSCPVVIPVGELVLDKISAISYEANSSLSEIIYYIDMISIELTKMAELTSKCNANRCTINCSCIPNPCYLNPAPICLLVNRSPCLQALGGCSGEACPREEIKKTVELIRFYENEIFRLLSGLKGGIEDARLILDGDLNIMRTGMQQCLGLGARAVITGEPEEEPFWMLLRCEKALGNKGPDGNFITDCHPENLYCCSSRPLAGEIRGFPSALRITRPPTYIPPLGRFHTPSESGFNNVPFFSQYDIRWRNRYFGCGRTIGTSGCGPASIAMALNFFGEKVDPPSIANWVLQNRLRVCGAGTAHAACCQAVEFFGQEENIRCKEFHGNIRAVLNELRNDENKIAVVTGRGAPPYTAGGHYIVLTGIEKIAGREFVHYNDSAFDPLRPERRPSQGRKPVSWFEKQGIGAGCIFY